jgi:hypothetical protein
MGDLIVTFHPYALERLKERGALENEIILAVKTGEQFAGKHGRTGFRLNFIFNGQWNNKYFATKQVEAYAINENNTWVVITVIVKFF